MAPPSLYDVAVYHCQQRRKGRSKLFRFTWQTVRENHDIEVLVDLCVENSTPGLSKFWLMPPTR